MKINPTEVTERTERPRRQRHWPWIGALALAFAGYSAGVFLAGIGYFKVIIPEMRDLTGAMTAPKAALALGRAPASWVRAVTSGAEPEKLQIDIKFEHLHRLHQKRDEALQVGNLVADPTDFVPAVINHDGRAVRVKLRLKGDLTDHLDGDKWSMRVHVKGSDHVMGMRRFSLQAPKTRNFQLEALFHEHLRREGILALRYSFVDVSINGKSIGLMALEEHFGKELLEAQRRREGVIVKFDESLFWDYRAHNGHPGPFNNFAWARVEPFESGAVARSPKLTADLEAARALLRGFVRGTLPAADVFDVDPLGHFMAIVEVWRAPHALSWINVRFYLNPLTSRLEPVGYDAKPVANCCPYGLVNLGRYFPRLLLRDPDIREAFLRHLPRLAREMADGSIQRQLEPLQQQLLNVLHREFPMLAPFEYEILRAHAALLTQIDADSYAHFDPSMGRADHNLVAPVVALIQQGEDGPVLELTNTLPVEVSVTSLREVGTGGSNGWAPLAIEGAELPIRLPPTPARGTPDRLHLAYRSASNGGGPHHIEGIALARGQERPYPFVAAPDLTPLPANPLPQTSLEEALSRHAFLREEGDLTLTIDAGVHDVDGLLVLPQGYGLKLGPGTTLRFETGAGIFAYGPLRFEGSEQAPVVLEPRGESFGGLYVVESERPSTWKHVTVRETAGFSLPGWQITGAVTFRRNPVTFEHCRFLGNVAEDAVNVVRSHFSMQDVEIADARSDAFDGDFVTGSFRDGLVTRIGGDGIDISGSKVEVQGTRLSDVRDKALSVGEGSQLTARAVEVHRSGIGMASKDRSEGVLEDSTLSEITHVALMAYTKKPEYGGASLTVRRVRVEGTARLAVAQTGSRIEIDGEAVPEEDVDIESLYDEGYMKK